MTEDEKIDATLRKIAQSVATATDEEFAARIVSLLIMDKGVVNAWQRTIETMIKVARLRDAMRPEMRPYIYATLDRALTGPKSTDQRRYGSPSDRLEYLTDAIVEALGARK